VRLIEYRVREFRSVWDSEPIEVDDQITCLVGKNEAGKTALLQALYRTNPIIPADANYDETYDYPKKEVEDYRHDVEKNVREPAVVVEATYSLEDSDREHVARWFGPSVLPEDTFGRSTGYGKTNSNFELETDAGAARAHLASNSAFSDALKTDLIAAATFREFRTALDAVEETETIQQTKTLVDSVLENGLPYFIYNTLLKPRLPKFLYFDEYYQMEGAANLNALIEREEAGELETSDHPLIGLINLARLDHTQLVDAQNTTELKNKLGAAGNHLTKRIMKYWSQNKHIRMEFDVRDAKPEDPDGMTDGVNVWGEVYDTVHWAHTPLGSRSRGFVWFFSFLAWYEDVKRQDKNVILLLDEPGLSLHGKAQADLLDYFEEELSPHQVIYSTHSPFMIDSSKFERVRIVQDLGIDAVDELPRDQDGTKVVKQVFDATEDSLFPLQGALGYEIQQTLFIGPNSLVVEGPADMLFIRAVSAELQREGMTGLSDKWVISPVGGCGKVPAFVSLLAPQKGMNIATLLDIQNKDKQAIENIYKKKLLKKKQVLTYADFLDQDEADVEDMFDREFYVSLVNGEYQKELAAPIEATDLNDNEPRNVRAVEAYLSDNPLKGKAEFGHYRPARYFVENISDVWGAVPTPTKERFANAFEALNKLLRKS